MEVVYACEHFEISVSSHGGFGYDDARMVLCGAVCEGTGPYPGALWNDPLTGIDFVWVPAGSFMMGSVSGHWDEQPVHEVVVSQGYWISKYEVTQAQWERLMRYNPSRFKGANRPVEKVSWNNCRDFVSMLNRQSHTVEYASPTEAQWEYAARGGPYSSGFSYAGSNDPREVAWCGENCGCSSHEVGQKKPNELGIYDMSGNVWEWTRDGRYFYSTAREVDPCMENDRYGRVCRGGGWNREGVYSRVTNRRKTPSRFAFSNIGVRLVVMPK